MHKLKLKTKNQIGKSDWNIINIFHCQNQKRTRDKENA